MKRGNNYLNVELCKRCGGECCKFISGGYMPEDFGEPLLENLTKAFQTGNYAVDWWEGDPTGNDEIECGYYVRPKVKGADRIYDPSSGGESRDSDSMDSISLHNTYSCWRGTNNRNKQRGTK